MSNPVFDRIDNVSRRGGYASFGRGQSNQQQAPQYGQPQFGQYGQPGPQDMSAQQLDDMYNQPAAGPVQTGLDRRMIVTPGPVLARIPSILAVAYGTARAPAVRTALRGGMIKGLITHDTLARSLLDLA